ncbi:MAG: type II secretion system F family protein [Lentisphaerae bacterium]|nr:type II secretion system F family protein [Lentisphaerota bacterium]
MVFVIPRFAKMFEDIGHALPLPTRILIGLSNFMVNFGWLLLIGIVIFVVLFRRFLATPQGKLWWDQVQLKLPYLRDVVMASAFAQFARTLGLLIGNGVHVLTALGIVEKTISNELIAREIRNAREQVTDGATISVPLAASKVFPPLLTDMLAIGEETGDMAGALNHIAQRYEKDLDHRIRILTIILEPLLIVLMAGLVGFVAISILLAVFDLSSGLNV